MWVDKVHKALPLHSLRVPSLYVGTGSLFPAQTHDLEDREKTLLCVPH